MEEVAVVMEGGDEGPASGEAQKLLTLIGNHPVLELYGTSHLLL